jgi:hypothetical protein
MSRRKAKLNMKYLMTSLLCMAPLAAFAGPFGLDIGKTFNDYPEVVFEKHKNNIYIVKRIPAPNKFFDTYVVVVSAKSGICKIRAISETTQTSKYGTELNALYNLMQDALDKKYKTTYKKKLYSYLEQGSLWNEPKYYMMGLLQKEREAVTIWRANLASNNIQNITMSQTAVDQQSGFIVLDYVGVNLDDCNSETSADNEDGL